MNVTIRFGGTNEVTRDVAPRTTVGNILEDRNLQAVLGFGSNSQAIIEGAIQSPSTPLNEGDLVIIETKANTKAVAAK